MLLKLLFYIQVIKKSKPGWASIFAKGGGLFMSVLLDLFDCWPLCVTVARMASQTYFLKKGRVLAGRRLVFSLQPKHNYQAQ